MSVDFFDCTVCGESVCTCGDFERCECGRKWCSLECAYEDGFKENACKNGYEDSDDCGSGLDCWDCDNNQEEKSCKYCREEDFKDSILLEYALKGLEVTRQELIEMYKLENK